MGTQDGVHVYHTKGNCGVRVVAGSLIRNLFCDGQTLSYANFVKWIVSELPQMMSSILEEIVCNIAIAAV